MSAPQNPLAQALGLGREVLRSLPVAEVVALYPARPGRRETWTLKVRCPFCSQRPRPRGWTADEWGYHGHAIGAPAAWDFPRLGTRSADCGGGEYEIGPLPAEWRRAQ